MKKKMGFLGKIFGKKSEVDAAEEATANEEVSTETLDTGTKPKSSFQNSKICIYEGTEFDSIRKLTKFLNENGYEGLNHTTVLNILQGHSSRKYPELVGKITFKE